MLFFLREGGGIRFHAVKCDEMSKCGFLFSLFIFLLRKAQNAQIAIYISAVWCYHIHSNQRRNSMESPLAQKSKSFALDIIKLCNQIKIDKRETVLVNQLMLSGASIGARVREAYCLQDKADFIKKLQDALKDCSETEYWIELLIESGTYYSDRMILEKCIEIKKMLISTIAKESEAAKAE